ncbi:M14 family metallopeptidase [Paracidovorax valerianellae]|uniref:Zinc carboxypeptidase n=1 Tax=Paracidovorax valerianellae TaxID=187868 RepID=A0A1G6YDY9_9BURK|nr:M14 family metallocarboxypeptidase [Paracidovorax valerianellae]MDA8445791.1 M14 family metallocarboxypeptidase [Paracidovorax valerianellae]SDD88223.1 Zinc carboxypeptidase [Paracidovorax valerianellae]
MKQPLIQRSALSSPPTAGFAGAEPPKTRFLGTCSAVLASALLAACGSTPLPPWPSSAPPKATVPAAPRPQAARVVPPPLGTQRAEVVTSPVTSTPIIPSAEPTTPVPAPAAATAPPADLPYSAAVAARFPAPSVHYDTPGLAEGRRAFTTNAEASQWLQQLASTAQGATKATVLDLGQSQRGTPLQALVLTHAPGTDIASLDASGKPTVLLIGQQHGDEPAGGEALLVMARELSQGLLEPLLDRINVVIVPRANPDGAEAGTRATANGVDMNRDHLLLNTPEAQALARITRDYRPIAVLDAHEYTVAGRFLEKFGAIQKYDALLQYATTANVPEFLTKAAREWYHPPMVTALQSQGLTSEWYYTTSTDPQDRRVSMGGTQPDTGRNVNGLKNAVSMLIETRGVGIGRLDIQRRVHAQVTALSSALRSTAERAANLEQVRSFVVRDTAAQACRGQIAIEAGPTASQRDLVMLDPATGADRTVRVDWNSSLELRTVASRTRPCGYWLSPTAGEAAERLKLLGLQVMRVAEPGSLLSDSYQETSREEGARQDVRGAIAGQQDITRVRVTTVRTAIDVPAGSYYVPLNQPLANLAVAALEPDTQNSYFANHVITGLSDTARVMTTPSLVFEEAD